MYLKAWASVLSLDPQRRKDLGILDYREFRNKSVSPELILLGPQDFCCHQYLRDTPYPTMGWWKEWWGQRPGKPLWLPPSGLMDYLPSLTPENPFSHLENRNTQAMEEVLSTILCLALQDRLESLCQLSLYKLPHEESHSKKVVNAAFWYLLPSLSQEDLESCL